MGRARPHSDMAPYLNQPHIVIRYGGPLQGPALARGMRGNAMPRLVTNRIQMRPLKAKVEKVSV